MPETSRLPVEETLASYLHNRARKANTMSKIYIITDRNGKKIATTTDAKLAIRMSGKI